LAVSSRPVRQQLRIRIALIVGQILHPVHG